MEPENNEQTQTLAEQDREEFRRIRWRNTQKRVGDLKFHPKNPRIISPEKIKAMQESLNDFGYAEVVTVNLNNVIVAGHARVSAMMADGKENELIDVRTPNRLLSQEEHEKLMLISNKMGEDGWDYDILLNDFDASMLLDVGFKDEDFEFDANGLDIEEETPFEDNDPTRKTKEPTRVTCPHCSTQFDVVL